MPLLEIVVVALALSIDSFAVALAASASGRLPRNPRAAARLAFHFGLFQFLMPVLGWAAGASLKPYIESFDHWVAFALLTIVGIRMLRASRNPTAGSSGGDPSRGLSLLALSTAVSVDALAVGLSLGMLGISIWTPGLIIGCITAGVSFAGIFMGSRLHVKFGGLAELVGGIVLILIAVRIVLAHELQW